MKRSFVMITSIVVALLVTVTSASAMQATPGDAGEAQADLRAATEWLMSQQDESGGFPGFDGEPEVSITVDAMIALVAAQLNGVDTGSSIEDAVAFIEAGDGALVYAQTGPGQAAKLVLGAAAYGGDPHDVAGVDPLSLVESGPSPDTGFYGAGVYDHALALLALGATGTAVPDSAITVLIDSQAPGGGWAFDGATTEGAADSNTTALVIMALVATGHGDSPMIGDGLAYLHTTLVGDSGATFQPARDAVADSNSTALVLQAVIAAGDDPASQEWGNLPAALASFQNDSGAFFYNETDPANNIFSTVQAIPAVAGYAQPVMPEDDIPTTPVASPVALRSVPARPLAA